MDNSAPSGLHLPPLAPYEAHLLAALAFFRTQRRQEAQAHHCLSMYLRQSEARIMGEVGFYARRVGISPEELLEMISGDPDRAQGLIQGTISPLAPGDT